MIELKNTQTERAILVAVRTPDISKDKVEEHLDELELLSETAGAEAVFKVLQDRARVDSAYFIGKGKAEEISISKGQETGTALGMGAATKGGKYTWS